MAKNQEGIKIEGVKKKSIANLKTVDLLCEGPIDGLVDTEFTYVGTLGNVGWDSVTRQPSKNFLRSVYLNGTPVVDEQGLYNFQNIETSNSVGLPNGFTSTQQFLRDADMQVVGIDNWSIPERELLGGASLNKVKGLSWPNVIYKKEFPGNMPSHHVLQSTEQVKYGEHSLKCARDSSYIYYNDSDNSSLGFNLWYLQSGRSERHPPNDSIRNDAVLLEKMEFTFDAWIYPTSQKWMSIFSHGYPYEWGGFSLGTYNGKVHYTNGGQHHYSVNGSIVYNQWQHLRVVMKSRHVAIYINGERSGGYGYFPYGLFTYNHPLMIGGQAWHGWWWNGYADNIRYSKVARMDPLYDTSFTAGQMTTDEHTLLLLDAEEMRGIVPRDTSASDIPVLINGSEIIESNTFTLQWDAIRANGEFYDISKANSVVTAINGASGPTYESSGGPDNGSYDADVGYLNFDSDNHNTSTADMLTVGPFNYDGATSSTPFPAGIPIPSKASESQVANPSPYLFFYNGEQRGTGKSNPGFDLDYPMQVEFWYKDMDWTNGAWGWVAGVSGYINSNNAWAIWKHPSNGHLYFQFNYHGPHLREAAISYSPYVWNHWAITWDRDAVRIFYNGEQKYYWSANSAGMSNNYIYQESRFCIGARAEQAGNKRASAIDGQIYNFRILQGKKTYGGSGEGTDSRLYFTPTTEPFAGTVNYDDENRMIINSNPIDKTLTLRAEKRGNIGKPITEGSLAQLVTVEANTNYTLKCKAAQPKGQGSYFNLVVWDGNTSSEMNLIKKSKDSFFPANDGETMSEFDSGNPTNPPFELKFNSGHKTSIAVGAQILQDDSVMYFDDFELVNAAGFRVSKVVQLSEKLRGPTVDQAGNPAGDNYSKDMFAKKYRIINNECISADVNISIDRLFFQNKDNGNTEDWDISNIIIQYRPLYNKSSVDYIDAVDERVEGMTQSGFVKSYPLDFSNVISEMTEAMKEQFYGWEIRVYRTAPESTDTNSARQTTVKSIVEHYSSNMTYPFSAISINSFNAEYFSNVPSRSFDVRMLKVLVPSNYAPISKTYDESTPWDGTFAAEKVWTDNPAWCFYDLITNPRYGLGEHIPLKGFDKWTLYQIAKYCDTIVPDGAGGMEPRFTLNLVINSREDAYKVINDMASVFRGILYYAAGQVYALQDSEKLPIYTFTNANVKEGNFTYNNTHRKDRHNVCIVRYNDKHNFYKPAIEYVEDIDGIRSNGIREQELTAFGCTSRGQAIRLGKWLVYTENLEIETVTFEGGLEASMLKPGDNVSITDANRLSCRRGGRTTQVDIGETYPTITLDAEIDSSYIDNSKVYNFSILTPTFTLDPYNVSGMAGNRTDSIRRTQVQNLLFSGEQMSTVVGDDNVKRSRIAFDKGIAWLGGAFGVGGSFDGEIKNLDNSNFEIDQRAVFSIYPTGQEFTYGSTLADATEIEKVYRIVNITENEKNLFKIQAVQNTKEKYSKIEDDLKFEEAGLYNSPTLKVPDGPSSLVLKLQTETENTIDIKYQINSPGNRAGLDSYHVFMTEDDKFPIIDFTGNYPYLFNEFTGYLASGFEFMTETPINEVVSSGKDLVPDDEKRIAVVSAKDSVSKKIRPRTSGEYAFRVFSANAMNQYSSTCQMASIYVPYCDPIKDYQVENLRLSTDEVQFNLAGTPDNFKTEYTGGSPEITWTSSLAGSGIVTSDIKYRMTVREQTGPGSAGPSDNILFEVTGLAPTTTSQSGFAYTYNLYDNLQHTSGERNYDIVIEAHDVEGNSSAGGRFGKVIDQDRPFIQDAQGYMVENVVNIDSTFTNPTGFDIVTLSNTKVDNPYLSTSPEDCEDSYKICTSQDITLDNKIKLIFNRNTHQEENRDMVGGFMYLSPNAFSETGVYGKSLSELPAEMERIRFDYNQTVEVVPTGNMLLDGSVFMAYSLYDSFDAEKEALYLSDTSTNAVLNLDYELASELATSIPREVKLDDMNTVKKIIKGGTQELSFELPEKRQWLFIKVEGSIQGNRVTYTNTVNQAAEKWQKKSELENWEIYVNDVKVDNAENWASNPPPTKIATFCENSKWNGSTDKLPIYNIQSKGVPLDSFKNDQTLTVKLLFKGTNVEFVNFSAEVDYGRKT